MKSKLLSLLCLAMSFSLSAQTVVDIVVNSNDHNTLEAAVIAAELNDDLAGAGPFTVFAPTDDAFDALPPGVVTALLDDPTGRLADILLYHVLGANVASNTLTDGQMATTLQGQDITVGVNGDDITINGALVSVKDIPATNGVVHVIDAVILPTYPATVVDVIVGSAVHETLEAAVGAAGLVDALSGDGPFTVFAPTDDAFGALPEGLVASLLEDPTGRLADILLYHVAGAEASSGGLTDGQMVTTLQGQDVTVAITDGVVTIDGAEVTLDNIYTGNGIVHVIDAVILPTYPSTVVDVIVDSDVHTTLEAAVGAAGLVDALSGDGPFTVFAPTDDAFDALPDGVVASLLEDPTGRLADILLYHVVGAEASSGGLMDGQMVMTLQGQEVTVAITDGVVTIDGAEVTLDNIYTGNGIVHVIDAVILPTYPATVVDVIVGSDVHTTLEAAVGAAGLVDALSGEGPFTVFAPTDDAFDALPDGVVASLLEDPTGRLADILLYHVAGVEASSGGLTDGQMVMTLQGQDVTVAITDGVVTIDGAEVTLDNIYTGNGIVHVIDAVILPTYPATVVDVIVDSDVHTTLEAAVGAAGLVDALSGDGPFTVFAPTDDAFDALPDGVVASLLEDPTGRLADILLYHVVGAEASSGGLTDGQMVTTLQGQDVTVAITDGVVTINGAEVTLDNIYTNNGIVHVIDAVLLPTYPGTVVDIIVDSDVHTTLEAAVGAAGLVDALSGDGPFTVFAPTDDAFGLLPEGLVTALLEDPTGRLADILLYHVLGAEASSGGLTDDQMIMTLQGQDVTVKITDGNVFINDALVSIDNIYADNGIVHVIDGVLLPTYPSTVVDVIVNSAVHETLEAAVGAAGLVDALSGDGPFTVFAPTDDAFGLLPEGLVASLLEDPTGRLADILLYHVVGAEASSGGLTDGQTVMTLQGQDVTVKIIDEDIFINDALVSLDNIYTGNGIVHVIDAVLLPTYPATVVDIIVDSDIHTTLETAVTEAELVDALSGDGPFTVFAPTDDAFDALPDGLLTTLLMDPTGDLALILQYHVAGVEASSGGLTDGQLVPTLVGESVTIDIDAPQIFVDEAEVTLPNLYAGNGIVHVINAVLLPNIVSVQEVGQSDFDISFFPNPVSDYLVMEIQDASVNTVDLILFNQVGQPVRNWRMAEGTRSFDLQDLPAGTYFMEVRINGNSFHKKLLKQ